jgi:hypothetical protein
LEDYLKVSNIPKLSIKFCSRKYEYPSNMFNILTKIEKCQ